MAHVTKKAPGKYVVWVGDLHLEFKTERDAWRFANAEARAVERSWQHKGAGQ